MRKTPGGHGTTLQRIALLVERVQRFGEASGSNIIHQVCLEQRVSEASKDTIQMGRTRGGFYSTENQQDS